MDNRRDETARLRGRIDTLEERLALAERRAADAEEARRALLLMLEDLHETQAAIERGKREWELTFDAVADPIFTHDRSGAILRANRAYAEAAGVPVERLTGRRYWELFPRREGPMLHSERAVESGEAADDEIALEDGRVFRGHAYAVRENDDATRVVELLEEITEQRKAERALRESEELFRSIAATAQDAIVLMGDDGCVAYWNPAAERIFGYGADEAIGRSVTDFIASRKFQDIFRNSIARFRTTGEGPLIGRVREFTARHRDGDEIPVELSVSAVQIREAWHGLAIVRDISERKSSERRLNRALEGTIRATAALTEARDPYTAGHQRRTAQLAAAIATEMGLDAGRILGIRMGALIHDVGKINIPAELLTKPTKLTDQEFSLIRQHPLTGHEILRDIDFPWPVAVIALQHHERLDGSGYPAGLKGEAIALEARIIAVADVVEAMASHRPYRPGHGIEAALDEIRAGRGARFDADAVDACVHLFDEKGFEFEPI